MKVGIAIMVRKPIDFDVWLKYHIKYLKFSHIYIRIEDTPGLQLILDQYKKKVTAIYVDTSKDNPDKYKNQYFSQMKRQKIFVDKMINLARKDKMDYLLHIDDDELFFLSDKFHTVNKFFRHIKDKVPRASQIHFKNVEAIFKKDKKTCFDTDKFIKCKKRRNYREPGCKAYINGKSAGNLSDYLLKYYGPHIIKGEGEKFPVDINVAKILHFESCSYDKWYDKFKNMSDNLDDNKLKKIPFKFYKNSLDKIKKCKDNCRKDTYKFWEKIKVDPYYNKEISEYLFVLTRSKELEDILENN